MQQGGVEMVDSGGIAEVTCIHRRVPEECAICGEFPQWMYAHRRWTAHKDMTSEEARAAFWAWFRSVPWGRVALEEHYRQRGAI